MSLIPGKSFDSVAAADLPAIFGDLAAARPLAARLKELRRTPTTLVARLDAAGSPVRVVLRADSQEITDDECSACGACCVHVAAALLAWIDHRDKGRAVQAPSRLGRVDRALETSPWASGRLPLEGYFDGRERPRVEVDLADAGPALRVRMTSGDLEAVVKIPAADAPSLLWNLPRDWKLSERARAVRVSQKPLQPELRADYDEEGRLRLQPVYRVPARGALPAREIDPGALEQGLAGTRWYFDGAAYHPLGSMPKGFQEYFKGAKKLVREGDEIPEFLEGEFQTLTNHVAFRPTLAVQESRVVRGPQLSAVNVETGAGDWLSLDPVYQAGDHRIALREVLALQKPRGWIRKGAAWIAVDAADAKRQWGSRGELGPDGRVRMRRLDYLQSRGELKADLAVEGDAGVRAMEQALDRFENPVPGPLPKGLQAELRPYQKTGYDWLRMLRGAGLHGVLADDMGLGKTHQTMAFLLSLYEEGARKPSLVVCPTSVMDAWIDKIRQYAPGLRPYKYYQDRKPEILALPGMRVVVTTYTVLIRDIDQLSRVDWEAVVLDEAHCIKTTGTQVAQAARRLQARTRLALTGTPIENRLDELWSVFEFLLPGYLGSAESFRRRFEVPIVRGEDGNALARLRKLIDPFKLRRMKSEVLSDLPAKVEDVRFCELTPHQAALYRALVEKEKKALDELEATGQDFDAVSVFAALSKLKRICDHPALVLEGGRTRELASGKFEVFKELMDESLRSGQKVVVFTQYLEMMDLIEDWLRARRVRFAEIRGNTKDRAEAIREFNSNDECRVFVCSLLAGGVGIDLTAASVVIHYDRWWNASKEDQATDRVHRIGQRRGVQVFKLVTRGTLEEKIDRMIATKGELMNSVVQVDPAAFKRFSGPELRRLLTLEAADREEPAVAV